MNTLNTPLADPAPAGTPMAAAIISSLSLNNTLNTCRGCTFFIPIDDAFTAVQPWLDSLNGTEKEAVLRTHVCIINVVASETNR
jgi:hypothetical protein